MGGFKRICVIPNEAMEEDLKKPMIAQVYLHASYYKGNKQKMGRKQNIKDEDESSRIFKEGQEGKSQSELIFLNITKDKMGF